MFILFYAVKIEFSGQDVIYFQCSVSPKMYLHLYVYEESAFRNCRVLKKQY